MRPFCSSCIKQLHVPQRYGSASNMTRTRVNELPLRRQAIFRASSTSSVSSQAEDGEQCPSPRTWFLEKESTPSARSSTSETGHTIATRQPKFTTFDPSSTTPDQPSRPLTPLHPEATSPLLRGLYEHLTTSSGDVMPDSVVFLHTASSQKVLGNVAAGGELIGNTGGARWDWIIVAQVRGRGKGVIGRAERSLRKWLKDEFPATPGSKGRVSTESRAQEDNDWTIVDIGEGASVNLLTADGRERWDLEGLWRQ